MSIGVSPGTVDRMVEDGSLPRPRIWHTRKLWIVSEIEAAVMDWPTDESDTAPGDDEDWTATL